MRHLLSALLAIVWVPLAICASAMGAAPESFLQLNDGTLRVTAGRPVRLKLITPERQAWAVANIGQFQVRTFGKVETIPLPDDRSLKELTYTFEAPGYAMVLLAAGPGSSRGFTDSVQRTPYCAKVLVRVDPDPSSEAAMTAPARSPGLTAKAGMTIEVTPYIDPTTFSSDAIQAGADLPVRVYFQGTSQPNATVMAYGPDGAPQRQTTDSVGVARFRIDKAGRWLVRYQHVAGGVTFTGDLLFEVGTRSWAEKQ